jgi:hypothetical protein
MLVTEIRFLCNYFHMHTLVLIIHIIVIFNERKEGNDIFFITIPSFFK